MLTWLYVPGDRPDRFAKALASGADTVILDLEDGVAPDRHAYARDAVAEFLAAGHTAQVRIRDESDVDALAGLAIELRLPKVESPDQVRRIAAAAPGAALHPLIETARGVEAAHAIAVAHPAVASIGLGEADLASDLGVTGADGLAYPRGRLVVAARAAGLPAPAMSVYPHLNDLAGLAASCATGRRLGFLGRAAIHPRQLPVIVDAFRPTVAEVAHAREVLAAAANGPAVLSDGSFADSAMVAGAERVIALAGRYGGR